MSEETALKMSLLARNENREEALGSCMCSLVHSLRASLLGVGTGDNDYTHL